MNPELFRDSPSGRVTRVAHDQEPYWAFVPNRLPPKLPVDWDFVSTIDEASGALHELAGLGRNIPNPHLLIGPFLRREAILSSRIEGTQADVTELYAYEVGRRRLPRMDSESFSSGVREVANYVRALEYGLDRVKSVPVSLRVIKELHERLMAGVRGERSRPGDFRRIQNYIAPHRDVPIHEATFVPPPVNQMHEALDAFEEYLHNKDVYPPLVRLALIHYQFEAIHPFEDGNGRIGRLLISLLLVEWGLLPLPLLYLSAFFERFRDDYFDLLLAVSQRGTWRDWVIFFLRGVAEQSRDAMTMATRLQDLQIQWRQRLTRARASALLLRLADSLFQSPWLTIPEARRILDVSYPSARYNVLKLVDAGILRQMGDASYGKIYVSEEILDLMRERWEEHRAS